MFSFVVNIVNLISKINWGKVWSFLFKYHTIILFIIGTIIGAVAYDKISKKINDTALSAEYINSVESKLSDIQSRMEQGFDRMDNTIGSATKLSKQYEALTGDLSDYLRKLFESDDPNKQEAERIARELKQRLEQYQKRLQTAE